MQQNQTIRLDINLSDSEIRTLRTSIQNLTDSVNILGTAFGNTQGSLQALNHESGAIESIFATQRTTMTYLRDASFMLGDDFSKLTDTLDNLRTSQVLATISTGTLKSGFTLKGAAASTAAVGVGILSGALKALPFIGIGIAALSLVGNLINLFRRTNDTSDATDNLADRIANLRDEFSEASKTHSENIQSIRKHNRMMNNLIDTVIRLAGNTGDCVQKQNQLNSAIALLNANTTGYIFTLDSATGSLSANNLKVLENMRTYHNLNSAMTESDIILDELIELHERYTSATTRVNELETAYNELTISVDEYAERANYLNEATVLSIEQSNEFSYELTNLVQRIEDANTAIYEIQDELMGYQAEVDETRYRIAYLEEQHAESFTNMNEIITESVANQVLFWDSLNEHQQGVMNNLKDMITSYTAHAQNRMSTLSDEVTVTGRQMMDNMLENQRVLETWADNIADLAARGIDEGLLEEMRQMGPEGAAQVAAMVDMTQAELDEMSEIYRQGAQIAADALNTQLGEGFEEAVDMAVHFVNDMSTTMIEEIEAADFKSIGKEIPNALVEAIEDGTDDYCTAVRYFAAAGSDAYKAFNEIYSPSRLYKRFGKYITEGLVLGLEEYEYKPVNFMQKLVQDMKKPFENTKSDFSGIGNNLMQGLNQGLLAGEGAVMATARRIASNIAATMRSALAINSPSRLMREQIGRQIPAGVAAGIDKYADYALDSVHDLGKDLLKVKMPKMSDIINFGPSLSLAGAGSANASHVTQDYSIHNDGMFNGATFEINNDQDIDRIMEKMAQRFLKPFVSTVLIKISCFNYQEIYSTPKQFISYQDES